MRVERGSLLSVPHRGTPRLIVVNKYNRILRAVNSKIGPVNHHRVHGVHREFFSLGLKFLGPIGWRYAAESGLSGNCRDSARYGGGSKQTITMQIEIDPLKQVFKVENAITTTLEDFDLVVEPFDKGTVFTLNKIVGDFLPPGV